MKLKVPHQVLPSQMNLWVMHNLRTGRCAPHTISQTRSGAIQQMNGETSVSNPSGYRYFWRQGWRARRILINVLVPTQERFLYYPSN